MAEHDEETSEAKITRLEAENAELHRQVFIAKSMIDEIRQALSTAQVAQAQLNGQIKYANQATL